MSSNEKFAWVAAGMVTGFSLLICLAPGMWLAVAAAVLLMACFTAAAQLERAGGSLLHGNWYYLIPLVIAPGFCTMMGQLHSHWPGIAVSLIGGVATHVLARAFPVFAEPRERQFADR